MFDGFWYGLFGGALGSTISQWLSKFKYWVIFLVVMVSTHIVFFAVGACERGLPFAIQAFRKYTVTPVGILFPIGVGAFAVFVAFLGSRTKNK